MMAMACAAPKSEQVYSEVDIDEYTGLSTDGLSWTYRDDGDMETSPDKDSLLRSRHVGTDLSGWLSTRCTHDLEAHWNLGDHALVTALILGVVQCHVC